MTSFNWAKAIAERPRGDTRAALIAAYGDPKAGATNTTRGQFEPPAEYRRHMVKIQAGRLPGFPRYADPSVTISGVTFHERVAPVFLATWLELERRGLAGRLRTYDGAITFRHMLWNYSNPVSVHAYGAAIDFDARWNGYGLPAARMEIDMEVVRCFEECGWHWGGRWNPTDGMHFQWTDPLPGVDVPDWQDAMAAPPAPTVEIIVTDLAGQEVPATWKRFVYNDTLVEVKGNRVSMQRRKT